MSRAGASVAPRGRYAASSVAQTRTLISLRWHMVRSPGMRVTLAFLLIGMVALAAAGHVAGVRAQALLSIDLSVAFATLFIGFALLTVITPLTAGGGVEAFPRAQLVSYPVRATAQFLTSAVLAPLNLAWVAQALTLTMLTGYVAARTPHPALAQTVTWTYLLTTTLIGQALAWWLVGVRATRRGRVAVWAGAIVLAAGGLLAWQTWGSVLLERSPTTTVALATLYASGLRWRQWLTPIAVLLALAALSVWLGGRACGWATRRPGDTTAGSDARHYPRRAPHRSLLATLHAVDVASVLRSTPLRRGLIVLTVLPALFAAPARLDWSQLVLLPGLVLAGAGLLFGVNVFCLDGPGALYLAASPAPARLLLVSKGLTLVEVCALAGSVAVAVGAVTARGTPTAGQAAALAGGLLAETAVVVAACLRWSLRHPHRADLRDRRDTPAPPGSMALYAASLAVRTTMIGLVLSALGQWTGPGPTLAIALAVTLVAVRSLIATDRAWADERTRSWVLTTVATG